MEIIPNLIIPGAGRSGSTALVNYLDQHENVFVTKVKEPDFFSKYYGLGFDHYLKLFEDKSKFSRLSKWYYLTKEKKPNAIYYVDASTGYFIDPNTPERLKTFNPEMKLIFMIRNPVDRAYSSYNYEVQNRGEKKLFDDIVYSKNIDEIQEIFDIKSSLYYTNISRFLKYFKKSQCIFIISEYFFKNSTFELMKICNFLNIKAFSKINISKFERNQSMYPISRNVQNFIYNNINKRWVDSFSRLTIDSLIHRIFNKINHYPNYIKKYPKLNNDIRGFMMEEFFHIEIKKLEKLLNIDLSIWNG